MKISNNKITAVLLMTLFALSSVVFDVRADGKKIFLSAKCNKCHEGAGIALLPKDAAAESEEGEEVVEKKVEPPKLDGIGAKILKEFGGTPEAVMTKLPAFLRKEASNSKGKKHKKKTTLTDAQLQEVIPWLLKL